MNVDHRLAHMTQKKHCAILKYWKDIMTLSCHRRFDNSVECCEVCFICSEQHLNPTARKVNNEFSQIRPKSQPSPDSHIFGHLFMLLFVYISKRKQYGPFPFQNYTLQNVLHNSAKRY